MRKYQKEEAVIAIYREIMPDGDHAGQLVCIPQYATPLLKELLWYHSTNDILKGWINEPGFYILKGGVYKVRGLPDHIDEWRLYHDTSIKKFISGSSDKIFSLVLQMS